MQPVSVKIPETQRDWLDQQAQLITGLTRSDAIRLCIAAAMNRGEPLIRQHQQQDTNTTAA
jgi:hypothetical protein